MDENDALTAGPVVLDSNGPYQTCVVTPASASGDLQQGLVRATDLEIAEIGRIAFRVVAVRAAAEKGTEEYARQGDAASCAVDEPRLRQS